MKILTVLIFLKEATTNIWRVLLSIFLIVLAIILFIPLAIGAMIWKVVVSMKHENRKAREILQGTAQFFTALAVALDQLGNVAFGGFLNWLFIGPAPAFPFGNTHETVSEVLGWNQQLDNLTRHGKFMVEILNWIEIDHCEKAMLSGLDDARYKLDKSIKIQDRFQTIERTKQFLAKYS